MDEKPHKKFINIEENDFFFISSYVKSNKSKTQSKMKPLNVITERNIKSKMCSRQTWI